MLGLLPIFAGLIEIIVSNISKSLQYRELVESVVSGSGSFPWHFIYAEVYSWVK